MPEEISPITETPQPTVSKPLNWPKIILAAILAFGLLVGAAYAGHWYGTQQVQQVEKPVAVSQPTPTPTPTLEAAPLLSPTPEATSPPTPSTVGTVAGKLCYPSQYLPKGELVAKDVSSGEIYTQEYIGSGAGGGDTYSFSLPIGKYVLRYQAQGSSQKPELFLSGYYTICAIDNAKCSDTEKRPAIPVKVVADQTTSGVDLCDFYYSPETEPDF